MSVDGRVAMSLVMLAIFVSMVLMATAYPPDARLLPFVIGIPGSVLALIQVGAEIADARRRAADAPQEAAPGAENPAETASDVKQELVLLGTLVGLVAAILLLGFWVAIPLFLVLFLRFHERESWTLTLALTGGAWITLYVVFDQLLGILVFEGFLFGAVVG